MNQIFSHPGKPLITHLHNVMELGLTQFRKKILNFKNCPELFIKIVLVSHDFGKATTFFQKRLLQQDEGDKRANHGLLSAVFTHYLLNKVLNDPLLSLSGFAIVARHHGNLKDFRDIIELDDNDFKLLREQYESLDIFTLDNILKSVEIDLNLLEVDFQQLMEDLEPLKVRRTWRKLKRSELTTPENYLMVNFVYSLLIWADKTDAIFYSRNISIGQTEKLVFERKHIPHDTVDKYKILKGWDNSSNSMDIMRNKIYDEIIHNIKTFDLSSKILSINVPTGTGKTLAALSAALNLKERLAQNNFSDYRIIYALPFTSIIDQNYEVFYDVFEKTGLNPDQQLLLKHHHLTPKSFYIDEEYDDQYPDVSEHLVETWNSEIIVTTFVQLLHTIFSNSNRGLKKFHQIANSIILLDEVQSIPHYYWELIREIFKFMSNILNCYFILITATMPLIFDESAGEIVELASSKKEYFSYFDRIDLELSQFQVPMTINEFKEKLVFDIEKYPDKSFLIVLNTIGTSLELYQYLRDELGLENLVYLSTNIIPLHRVERIMKIKRSNTPLIIISTQMIEAGVDIDIDRVYRDFGPLDALNQTSGRCNRNFDPKKRGQVILFSLKNEKHNNKLYGSYVYGEFLLSKTRDVLMTLPQSISERDFYLMNFEYFKRVNRAKSDDLSQTILERINMLMYETAFYNDSNKNDGESKIFQLIKNDRRTVNLFIELDKKAEELWIKFEEIKSIADVFERKNVFEKIKGEFLNYVISVPVDIAKKQLDNHELESLFNRISRDQINGLYDPETGFIRSTEEKSFIF